MKSRLALAIFLILLLAAHFLRNNGIVPALFTLVFIVFLYIRKNNLYYLWQLFWGVASLIWLFVTLKAVFFRIDNGMDWIRLAIILGIIVILNIWQIFIFRDKRFKERFEEQ